MPKPNLSAAALSTLSRRTFLIGGASLAAVACTPVAQQHSIQATAYAPPPPPVPDPYLVSIYSAMPNERFPVPAVDITKVDPQYLRQRVPYAGSESAGTIVVDPDERFLYLVMEDGFAMRYGVGVGREGFGWSGRAKVQRKAEWPTWTPPTSMIERQPELAEYAGGMEPGLDNPLGARALYLYQGGRDTLFRIHGTNEPWSIGRAMSSGCIRLFNQDIVDLYERTPIGTPVVVREHSTGVYGA